MIIHSLEIHNIRGVGERRSYSFKDTGITLISGDNESGKSSIMRALSIIFDPSIKYSTKSQKLAADYYNARTGPMELAMEATVGDIHFRIEKSFNEGRKGSRASFTDLKTQKTVHNDEAENKLGEVLSHIDRDLYNTLFIQQGGFDGTEKSVNIAALRRSLEGHSVEGDSAEVLDALGSAEDTMLMDKIQKAYEQYFNKNGSYKKPLVEKKNNCEKLEKELDALKDKVDEFDCTNQKLQENKAEYLSLEAGIAELEAYFSTAKKELERVQGLENEKKNIEKEADIALNAWRTAQEKKDLRQDLIEKWEEWSEKATILLEEKEKAEQDRSKAIEKKEELEEKIEKTTQEKKYVHWKELEAIAATVEKLQQEKEALIQPSIQVTDHHYDEFVEAETTYTSFKRTKELFSARVEISTTSESSDITIDGDRHSISPDNPHTVIIDSQHSITYKDLSISLVPSAHNNVDEQYNRARKDFEKLCTQWGCSTKEEMRQLRDENREYSEAKRKITEELSRAYGSYEPDSFEAERHALYEEFHNAQIEPEFSTIADYDKRLALLIEENKTIQSILDSYDHTPISRYEGARAQGETYAKELEDARKEKSDEELEKLYAQAEEEYKKVEEKKEEILHAYADARIEEKKENRDSAENALHNRAEEMRRLKEETIRQETVLKTLQGSAEEYAHVKDKHERAQHEWGETKKEAQASKVLYETVCEYRRQANARYIQPFVNKVNSFATVLFGPTSFIDIDDDLAITGRSGVDFSVLSGGAQEQLAFVRILAIADLVSEADHVPIFIDDALGNSDKKRLEKVCRVINRLAQDTQIIIFTCAPSRFEHVHNPKRINL